MPALIESVKRYVILIACGCGSHSDPAPAPAPVPAPPVATKPADAGVADAPAARLASCTDGGNAFSSLVIAPDAVQFCLEGDSCWGLTLADHAVHPLASATATPGAITVADTDPPARGNAMWSATVTEGAIEVCGPAGCKPFAPVPGKPPDDDRAAVDDADVSPSGQFVAVTRGMEGLAAMTLEVYDRVSGRRLSVTKPKTSCVFLEGFAGDAIVLQEWDCANHGGNRLLVSPSGKQLARIARWYSPMDSYARIDGDRWAFWGRGDGAIDIYDTKTGARLGGRVLEQFARVTTAFGHAYAFEAGKARVYVYGPDGKELASGRAPTCRYEWETETIGALALRMPIADATKALGAPAKKTHPDPETDEAAIWTYASGVALRVKPDFIDPNTGALGPMLVTGVAIKAPSKLRIMGVGIGSTLAEVEAAFGAHRVAAHSTDKRYAVGNADDSDGLVFELADGKVAQILFGDGSAG